MRGVVVFDCLTLWLSNWMLRDENQLDARILELCTALRETRADVVAITNEVGCSIVPDNALARRFQDHSGLMNQRVADIADRVFLLVSGIPIKVK
jgi:adenosylcobinamide kinase/adenosylcobinamide-phosphate guanylyltransferase